MTTPANATETESGRTYLWPPTGEMFTSVTTILSVLSKPALVPWATRLSAEYVIRHWGQLSEIIRDDPAIAIDLIRNVHKVTTDNSIAIGDHVHAWVEADIKHRTGLSPRPRHMDQFDKWKREHRPDFIFTEATIYNRTEGYAGTADFLARIDGKNILVDVKTGKNIYPEAALQLTAYANGEFIGTEDHQEKEMPRIDGAAVLQLRMNSHHYYPVRMDDEVFLSFRYLKEAYRWQQYISKQVIDRKNGAKK